MRELIVGAIATKLAELRRPTKYLGAIVSVPRPAHAKAEEDAEFLSDIARAVNGRVPCIAIATGKATTQSDDEEGLEITESTDVVIYVVSGNQRGTVDGRLFVDVGAAADDTKDPGVFAILQHVTERVQGSDLGIDGVRVPRKTDEDEVATFDDVTIWGQTYSVDVDLTINPDRPATTVMTSIEAKHKGDGIPDATSLDPTVDTVTALDP
jgi:hypothetical protein